MAKVEATLNLMNAYVLRTEARDLQKLVYDLDAAIKNGSVARVETLKDQIIKERTRLDPCDKYDEEEVRVALIVKKRRQNGRT